MCGSKYKDFEEVVAAFKSGELDKTKYVLVLDSNVVKLRYEGDDMDEDDAYLHCFRLFRGHPQDIDKLITALGLPCEWC